MNYTVEKTNVQEFIKELKHYFRPDLLELCRVNKGKKLETLGLLTLIVSILDYQGKSPIPILDPDVFHLAIALKEGLEMHWEPRFEGNHIILIPLIHPGIDMDTLSYTKKILTHLSPDFLHGLEKKSRTKLHFLLSLLKYFIDSPTGVFKATIKLTILEIEEICNFFSPMEIAFIHPPIYDTKAYHYVRIDKDQYIETEAVDKDELSEVAKDLMEWTYENADFLTKFKTASENLKAKIMENGCTCTYDQQAIQSLVYRQLDNKEKEDVIEHIDNCDYCAYVYSDLAALRSKSKIRQ